MTIIEVFLKLGRDASYHYADDSGDEWGHGNRAQHAAMEIFMSHPDLQDEMRKQANFLWSLDSAIRNWERNNEQN